ncbi:hypothetical protein [Paenibacillus sp. D9]|uniref:hypothetical protein n=2 Tax=Paenibacillus TaxID=44249 RepID=UPI00038F85F6|nr:hypothetical protein [Paenibacillus sp. D9]KKC47038.1 hypothetical protein VE23_07590 [Paenibacillus sp. D9]CDN41616.1 Putative uncharacterized protein [Paenibacillus sp. P22]
MEADRRRIIVQEIQQWRKGKLLPDHYCDFLLNLYVTEKEAQPDVSKEPAAGGSGRFSAWKWISIFVIFSFFCLIVLHFSSFHPALQIALCLLATGGMLTAGTILRPRNETVGLSWIGLAMLSLAGLSLYLLHLHGLDAWGWKALVLGLCAAFWIAYGIAARIPLLHFSGWACLAIVYSLLLRNHSYPYSLFQAQLYWLPLAGLFSWSGWFAQRWSKRDCAVLLGFSALLVLMPEIALFANSGSGVWLQALFVGKLVIGGGALFLLRKNWIAWVA